MHFGDSDKHHTDNYSPNEFIKHALFNAQIKQSRGEAKVKMSFLAV